jgi:uncharacterized OsmC-like protein
MDSHTLRALQAPLKATYRDNPTAALVEIHATGDFRDKGVTCTVDGWGGPVRAGLHPATGGDGSDACSGDLLLDALVACMGVTLRSVATALNVSIKAAVIRAEATFDVRGTLGVDRDVPVGMGPTIVTAELVTTADDVTLERLGRTTERYCVVGQSLREPVHLVVRRAPMTVG